MDTQPIFEELKGELRDAAARSLTRMFAAVYEELRDDMATALQRLTIRTDSLVDRTPELQFRDFEPGCR
jgi:hypothetical protein